MKKIIILIVAIFFLGVVFSKKTFIINIYENYYIVSYLYLSLFIIVRITVCYLFSKIKYKP